MNRILESIKNDIEYGMEHLWDLVCVMIVVFWGIVLSPILCLCWAIGIFSRVIEEWKRG